jgi:hypothetical protein
MTSLGIYTIPIPARWRAVVEKLSQLVTDSKPRWEPGSPAAVTTVTQYGGRYRIRTCDFHRVKMALYR